MSKAVYKFDDVIQFHTEDDASDNVVAYFGINYKEAKIIVREAKFITVYESAIMGKIILLGGE